MQGARTKASLLAWFAKALRKTSLWKSVLWDQHYAERPCPAKEELKLCGEQLKEEGE